MTLKTICIMGLALVLAAPAWAVTVVDVDAGGRIPDSGTLGTSTYTFTVPDLGEILDLNVRFSASHTWDSDLEVSLSSPAGTSLSLFTDVGGSGDNFEDTLIDDEAPSPINLGTAPFAGAYAPENGSLSVFDGEEALGLWTLTVIDDAGGDIGWLYMAGDSAPWGTATGTQLIFDTDQQQPPPPNPIPEPVTVLGALMGLGAVGRYLRRR